MRSEKLEPTQTTPGIAIEDSRYERAMSPPQESPDTVLADAPKPDALPKLFGPPEWLIVGAFVAELLTLAMGTPSGRTTVIRAVSIGLCLSLPSMLAGWSAVRSGGWRYAVTVALSLLNGFILTWTTNPRFDWMLVLLPLASALPTLLTLWLIKRLLGRFAPLESKSEHFLEGLRFNLSHLFIVTTALAVLLAISKAMRIDFFDPIYPEKARIVFSLVALFSFSTLIFTWALMGRSALLRVCVVIPVAYVSIEACCWFCGRYDESMQITWYIITGVPLVMSFVLLVVFRRQGWRFWKTVK